VAWGLRVLPLIVTCPVIVEPIPDMTASFLGDRTTEPTVGV
jgi:hypothetical protein